MQISTGYAGCSRRYVRVVMTETDAEQIHGVCVWAVKVMPQRRVSAALKPMMQSAATRFGANQCKYRPCKISPYRNQTPIAHMICIHGSGSPTKKPLIKPSV